MWLSFQQSHETGYEALNLPLDEQQASHPSSPPKAGAGGLGETDCVYVSCGFYWCFEIPMQPCRILAISCNSPRRAAYSSVAIKFEYSRLIKSCLLPRVRGDQQTIRNIMLAARLYLLLLFTDLTFTFGLIYQIYCEWLPRPPPPLTLPSCQDAVKSIPVNSFPTPQPNLVTVFSGTLVHGRCALSIDLGGRDPSYSTNRSTAKRMYRHTREIAQKIVAECSGHRAGTAGTVSWYVPSGFFYKYIITVRVT